ncbi:MAG: hypothetical protein M0C28_31575 [Candidatus Moduliflexus flocculans]|nr:hypothetical protein [Candidatus Moduliflexus flocculans]
MQSTRHEGLLKFVQGAHQVLPFATRVFNLRHVPRQPVYGARACSIAWHGVRLDKPDFGDDSHSIACEMKAGLEGEHVFIMISAYWEPLAFELPRPDAGSCLAPCHRHLAGRRVKITASPGKAPASADGDRYLLKDRSVAVLAARRIKTGARAGGPLGLARHLWRDIPSAGGIDDRSDR